MLNFLIPSAFFTDAFSHPLENARWFIVVAFLLVVVYLLVFTERHLTQLSRSDLTVDAEKLVEKARLGLAQDAGLTQRETEVFLHLCEGRNAPWIAKELFISQSTANVHIKNIYRKFDVHSRQELLDLADKAVKAAPRLEAAS